MPRGVPRSGVRMTKKRMAALSVAPVMAQKASRFSINERFGFVGDMVTMLAQGDQASVVITGPGGLGKTFNVLSSLQKNGMQDLTSLEEFMEGTVVSTKKSFVVIKGYSTPKGLYRALYENRNGVIVFDDCDSILRDPVSLNLLKAALDSYERRVISWRADIRDDDLPTSFEFKGRVVFISNLSSVQLDQAILTRSLVVDLTMTNTQKVERMRFLLSQADFMPEYEREFKQDAMDLISKLQDDVKELSLRTLIQVTKIRKSSGKNWKNLAEYATCG
ncbi:MAG: Roseobacter phage Phi 2 [Bacteroidota bacterium]